MPPGHHHFHDHPQKTKWHVITGAPCSGKTSVIRALEKAGHLVVHEVARAIIDERLAEGTPLETIKSDILAFERTILQKKVEIERQLPRDRTIFMDRAVPDSIAYYELEGLSKEEPRFASRVVRYERVFLFERLSFEQDRVRTEDRAIARRIEEMLVSGYESLGYEIVRVPLLSIDARVTFILNHIETL